jgi:hypothetical protein
MTNFEFVFSLFGLLLGLGLAEVLGGFGKTIQEREKIRVGWLTPLLGIVVAVDLTSFWSFAWAVRDLVPTSYLVLLTGLLICGTYYLVARLVFPGDHAQWPDFDVYYFKHKKWVLGGVVLCNVAASAATMALGAPLIFSPIDVVGLPSFYLMSIAAFFARGRRTNIALLSLLAAQYFVFPLVAAVTHTGR